MSHKDLEWHELETLFNEVQKRSISLRDHPCILYDKTKFETRGKGNCQYGRLYKPKGGDIYAHQIVFLYNVGTYYGDKKVHSYYYPEELSHLCHNSLCVNFDHIKAEHTRNNKNRQKCNKQRKCTGDHIHYMHKYKLSDCIIVPKV